MKIRTFVERFQSLSERFSLVLKAIAGTGVLLSALYGFWSWVGDVNPKITEGARTLVGIDTRTPKVLAVLGRLGYNTGASRAFVIRYISEDKQLFSDFTSKWQWTQDGLTPIPYNLYPVWDGLSRDRYHRHTLGRCTRYITGEMGQDKLADSFRSSRTIAHFSCGGAQPPPGSRRGTFAVSVEFSAENTSVDWEYLTKAERDLRQTMIEAELIAAGGSIAEIIDK